METILPRTRSMVEAHLGRDLAGCVLAHFAATCREWFELGRCGEYETCLRTAGINDCLLGACAGGHVALAKRMVARNGNDAGRWERVHVALAKRTVADEARTLQRGLNEACRWGHVELANLMIAAGAKNWDSALHAACRGGHLALANGMIAKGATEWNFGLRGACVGGHHALARLMIEKGADKKHMALRTACKYGHPALAKLMVALGATSCSNCSKLHQ